MQIPERLQAPLALLERLYGWWLDEIEALIPARIRARFTPAPAKTVVTIEPGGLGLFRIKGQMLKPLAKGKTGLLGFHMPDWPRAIRAKLRSVRRVGVRVSPDLVLKRQLHLPLAVEERLDGALALQLDRHVPLRPALAYIDHRVLSRNEAAQTLSAEIVMAHRARLDPVLDMLKGAGFQVESVGLAEEASAPPLNFFKDEAEARKVEGRRAQALLVALFLLLALAGQSLIGIKEDVELAALQRKIDALAPEIRKAEGLSGELARLQDEQRLATSGRTEFDPLRLLNDLSARVPDGSWLTQLEFTRSPAEVRLTGFSANATALLGGVEASPLLNDARLRGPVTKDSQGRERFEAVARIAPEKAP
jgi:general secretion pathway protein L